MVHTKISAWSAREAPRRWATVGGVGRLIAIEGLDGAGKRTLADGLAAELERRGLSVARTAFPRYDCDVHAALVGEALRGDHGDLGSSVHGMAVLYALDRRCAAEAIRADLRAHDIVLLDRYVASNAAYGAARLHQDANGDFVAWVHALEVERFGLPRPDIQLLLLVQPAVAASRAEHRARMVLDRSRDSFEVDAALQERCALVYGQLATAHWWSPWLVVEGAREPDFVRLAESVVGSQAAK
jgi:dTMP kinase